MIRTAARSSRRRIPPLYRLTALRPVSASPNRSSSSSARAPARRAPRWCSRPNISRFCRPPSSSSTAACCPSRPMRRRTSCGLCPYVVPGHAHHARVLAQQRRHDPYRRGLARAVRPEHAVHRAAADHQVEPVQGLSAAVSLVQALDDDRVRHPSPPRSGPARDRVSACECDARASGQAALSTVG